MNEQVYTDLESTPDKKQPAEPTFGQQLVGYSFNPSGNPQVDRAKTLCAELADLLYDAYVSGTSTYLKDKLMEHAVGEILNAQMNVVKVITFK